MKRISLYALLLGFLFTCDGKKSTQTIYLSPHFTTHVQARETLSEYAVLLFDIHGVLFDRGNYVAALQKITKKKKFAKQTVQAVFSKKARAAYKKLKKEGNKITERNFGALQDFEHLHNELIDFSNNIFSPNKAMRSLLERLKKNGYPLYLLSNIGPVTLERLVGQHPTFFALMNDPRNTINRGATESTGTFVWKPLAPAYQQAVATVDKAGLAHHTLFVDDQIHNVVGAQKAGLNAILFVSPAQLERDLRTLLRI